MAFVT